MVFSFLLKQHMEIYISGYVEMTSNSSWQMLLKIHIKCDEFHDVPTDVCYESCPDAWVITSATMHMFSNLELETSTSKIVNEYSYLKKNLIIHLQ